MAGDDIMNPAKYVADFGRRFVEFNRWMVKNYPFIYALDAVLLGPAVYYSINGNVPGSIAYFAGTIGVNGIALSMYRGR